MIKPFGKRILVAITSTEQVSTGGLVLASNAKTSPTQGIVEALGKVEENEIKVGDTVIFNEFSGTKVTHEGKDYLVLDLDDVVAIIG